VQFYAFVARSRRSPLYSFDTGKHRRPRVMPRVSPWLIVAVVVLVALLGTVAYALWLVRPLTDRSAGVIPAGMVPSLPATSEAAGTGLDPAKLPAFGAGHATTRAIPGVGAGAGLVVEAETGHVLWMDAPHHTQAIASLTKMMTALVAYRAKKTRGTFVVTSAMTDVPGETIGISPGERVSARDMLAATLLPSANDAANALAVHTSGSLPAFVARMNATARNLGLHDTRFSNPSGIYDTGNHSSAWDVAQLARLVLTAPQLSALVGRKIYVPRSGPDYVNTNHLLWTYDGARGVKTGFTDASGRCLVAAATRDGRTLIAVVLNAGGNEFTEASRLLNWGFKNA
jgi:D-alanyl-D-alanine carboxypeptidase (penicillin-binding protein 5/6)